MPAQDALAFFPFESWNAAFKRNCSSVLYKAMFVCFSYFLRRDGWGQGVTILGVTDLTVTSLRTWPNSLLFLKLSFWLRWHLTGCEIMRIIQGELSAPCAIPTFSGIVKNFRCKYRVCFFPEGKHLFWTRSPSGTERAWFLWQSKSGNSRQSLLKCLQLSINFDIW